MAGGCDAGVVGVGAGGRKVEGVRCKDMDGHGVAVGTCSDHHQC